MFRHLLAWIPQGKTETEQMATLQQLAHSMLETADEEQTNLLDNAVLPAGYTIFAQLITNDLTFDPSSSSQQLDDPCKMRHFRAPRFALDGLYGSGPRHHPHFYDHNRPEPDGTMGFVLLGKGENVVEDDLPRNIQGLALIGDARHDDDILIAQLHLAFLRFHNQVLEALHAEGLSGMAAFSEAQRIVRWHYQWVILHDFLPRLVGPERVEQVRVARPFYIWQDQPTVPLEFLAATFRISHNMMRSSYILSDVLEEIRSYVGLEPSIPIFTRMRQDQNPSADLRGRRRLPRFWTVQWNRFLPFERPGSASPALQMSRQFNTKLAFRLGAIPIQTGETLSLPYQNLEHGWRHRLPSGQSVSRAMGVDPIYHPDGHDPLWFYILQEAALGGGEQLGIVGGSIVAEVLVGIIAADPHSFCNIEPTWTPEKERLVAIPTHHDEPFQLRDVLAFARMPISKSDIETIVS